jgi:hypothetical protein
LCRRFSMSGTVLEPSVSELAEARQRGLQGIQESFESWESNGRQWSVVTLWQTADHLLDVAGSLRKIRSLMAPGGMFVMDIVNILYLIRGFGAIEPVCKIDHPFGLNATVMTAYLLRAGFQLLEMPSAVPGFPKQVRFICAAGQPVNALPDRKSVDKLFSLIDEVRNAGVGV